MMLESESRLGAQFLGAQLLFALLLFLPVSVAAEDLVYGQGRLWQVTAPEGDSSHFFGTFHSTDPRILKLPPPVSEVLSEARTLALEIVLTPQEEQALGMAALLTDGRTLDQIVGPDIFARSKALIQDYGVPAAALPMFKPWGVMTLFARPPEEFAREMSGAEALDFTLQSRAEQQGKPVVALETVAEQIGFFDSFSDADQVAMLVSVLDYHDMVPTFFETMVKHYLAGDIAAIHTLATEQAGGMDPALQERFMTNLIDRRNAVMVERSLPLLEGGGAMIAVGALHLPGERGILRLLEKRGYKVARVL